jgi:hypothetical protein
VSDTVGKTGIVGPSIGWGTVFGAAIAFAILFCLVWSYTGGKTANGDFGLLMGLGEIPMVIIGGTVGAIVFGVVGVIVRFGPVRLAASPLSYAVLGSLVWGALCWPRALNVSQEGAAAATKAAYLLMLYGLLPIAIAGLLVGAAVRAGRIHAYRSSRPGANR